MLVKEVGNALAQCHTPERRSTLVSNGRMAIQRRCVMLMGQSATTRSLSGCFQYLVRTGYTSRSSTNEKVDDKDHQ
jgi:hypothetical protein